MEEDGMTGLMRETLEDGLSRLQGRPVRLRELHRERFINTSTWPAERLRVRVDEGEWLQVFFKDLSPGRGRAAPWTVPPSELKSPHHELRMYREVLAGGHFGTPELYASRWDPPRGPFWLFLEDVGGTRLNYIDNFDFCIVAARWAARFHAATRLLSPPQTDFLVSFDQAHDQRSAECVQRKLPDLQTGDRPLIQRALDQYRGLLDRFRALPQSVIHGEFFPKNIVVRSGRPEQPLAVIDWESAAVGPSYLDLASLTTGRWQTEQRQAMWRAYFEQYQADTRLPLAWDDFCRDLREVALYHTVKWLGSRPDWSFRRGIGGWVRELERILPG
jgi:hypothetical protein